MRPEHHYFDVSPVVVPADTLATIVIRPLHGHVALRDDATYEVTYYPCEEYAQRSGWPAKEPGRLRPEASGGLAACAEIVKRSGRCSRRFSAAS